MSVYLCGREFSVAEHLLDEPNISTILEHQRRHAMPKEVTCTANMGKCCTNVTSS